MQDLATEGRALLPLLALFASIAWGGGDAARRLVVRSRAELASVWAGHPVGFAFAVREDGLTVGFYDAERRMVIGHRALEGGEWTLHRTAERTGWDSHNSIAFGFDRAGALHVAANMHCVPLRYWRTRRPGDVTSLEALHRMTGQAERRCTYPRFLHDAEGRLLFLYRDGGSGNGRRLINAYDEATRSWSRLLAKPLLSGEGKVNAYPTPILTGPNGLFHIAWVWRDTPDCSTNHDVCYARSRDLKHWESSDGTPLALPLRPGHCEVVDPVPARGGLLNNIKLGFDAAGRPLIAYHKFDAAGNTQLILARREAHGWAIHQVTDWDTRWDFRGGGCIRTDIRYSAPRPWGDGQALLLSWWHAQEGSGRWLLDPKTLRPVRTAPRTVHWPPEVRTLRSDVPGMAVRLRTAERDGVTYVLRWETLGPNRDRPRPKDQVPPPSRLVLYELAGETP